MSPEKLVTTDDLAKALRIAEQFVADISRWDAAIKAVPEDRRQPLYVNGFKKYAGMLRRAAKQANKINGTFQNWKDDHAGAIAAIKDAKDKAKGRTK